MIAISTQVELKGMTINLVENKAAYEAMTKNLNELYFVGGSFTDNFVVSIPTGWTASGDFFTKTVSVPGITSEDNPIADVVLGSDSAANAAYLDAWGLVQKITTSTDSITLYATSNPQTAFSVQLKAVR